MITNLKQILQRFWPQIRKQRLLIAGGVVSLIAEIGLRLIEPWPLKFIFDRVIPHTSAQWRSGIAFLDSLDSLTLLIVAVAAIVLFIGLRAMAGYLNTIAFALAGNRVMAEIRDDLYNHIQCLPLSFHDKSRSGELIIRVMGDVALLQEVTVTAAVPLVSSLLTFIGMILVMFFLNWQLALITLLIFPIFWISTLHMSGRIREAARKQRRAQSSMAATMAESVSAIKTVQALSLEEKFRKIFSGTSRKSLENEVKSKRLSAGLERTVDFFLAIATALTVFFGALLVMHNKLTPGDLIVFMAYLRNAFRPLGDFAKYIGRLVKAMVSGERIVELLELVPEIRDLPDAVVAPRFKGEVRFQDVRFAYVPDRPVFKAISCLIKPKDLVVIVAPSGAGKSTFASLIMRLYEPQAGNIFIDGKDIRSYTLNSLRGQISVVLQDTLLFASSVRDNIIDGAKAASQEEVEQAAKLANAHDFIIEMPQGYESILGERGVTLSQGQRQRIAIARAAIRKSPILILDEPTAGLDKENELAVVSALEKLARNSTTLFITHDLRQARNADLIIYLEDGQIKESGSHTQLIQANGRYAAVYKLFELQGQGE